MDPRELPIVVFDSGVGGISVLRELRKQLPREQFLYFGDSANAPYGPRPTREVLTLTVGHMDRYAAKGCKAMVIACNTATSAAIEALRQRYDFPVIGIEPALKPAVDRHPGGRILVLATETTLREKKFARLTQRYREQCTIHSLPCPGLMEFVERGELSGPDLEAYLSPLLAPYVGQVDAAVLGCTHYPFVRSAIQDILGPTVELLDGSAGTARETARRLEENGTLRQTGEGSVTFENSLGTPEILALCDRLLNA